MKPNNDITMKTNHALCGLLSGLLFAGSGMDTPIGLAFDSAGNLYTGNDNHSFAVWIQKFTPSGTGSQFTNNVGNRPSGLAFDSAGNLFVANHNNTFGSIREFSPTGTDLGVFADNLDGLNVPMYLAFGPVPEPTSAALLLGSGAMLLLRRRRRA